MLIVYTNDRCNAKCSHCFYWQELNTTPKEKEISLEQFDKLTRSLQHPLNNLILTGGEPFIRDDIAEVCRLFMQNNHTKKINIVSNGYYTDRVIRDVETILAENTNIDLNIQISLDGLQELHDKIRAIAIFDRAIETIKGLIKLQDRFRNFHVTILTVLTKRNLHEIPKLMQFTFAEFPTIHHGLQYIRSTAHDVFNIDHKILNEFDPEESNGEVLTIDEMKGSLAMLKKAFSKEHTLLRRTIEIMNEAIIETKESQSKVIQCLAGTYDGVVFSDSNVSMCEFTTPFANLKDYDYNFHELWQSKAAQERRPKIASCYCTHTCNLMNAMKYDENSILKILNPEK